jgi:type IV secretion system protein TrbJ
MRRRLWAFGRLVLVTAVCAVLLPKPVARGGTVGYATEWTQLLNHLQLVDSYIRQGEELRQQIQMVLDMTRNSMELPVQVFGPIMDDLNRLSGIVQGGRSLAYSMASLDAEFRSRFQGWGYRERAW